MISIIREGEAALGTWHLAVGPKRCGKMIREPRIQTCGLRASPTACAVGCILAPLRGCMARGQVPLLSAKYRPSHCQISSIHWKRRTCHPGRFITGQKDGESRHIFRLTQAADGMNSDSLASHRVRV
jgi:hypothetical protein